MSKHLLALTILCLLCGWLQAAEAAHAKPNTPVIFASDNGGYGSVDKRPGQTVPVTGNMPLRSGKGVLYIGADQPCCERSPAGLGAARPTRSVAPGCGCADAD